MFNDTAPHMVSLINYLTSSHRVQVTKNYGRYSNPSPAEEIRVHKFEEIQRDATVCAYLFTVKLL